MSFLWPPMLLSLVVLPLLCVLYLLLHRRRRRLAMLYGAQGGGASPGAMVGFRRHVPPILFLAGLFLLLLALARPRAAISVPRVEGTVVLAFDVSGSMAADDLDPTRMDAARLAARRFVEAQPPTVRIGVVAFSEGGISVQPPSTEQEAILAALDRLKPESSTSLGNGILAAIDVIDGGNWQTGPFGADPEMTATPRPTPAPEGARSPAIIVLLTDGENTAPPDPFEAAQVAANLGIRIYPVGIGRPEGTTLEINGFNVYTQLDEGTLRLIADITGATYYSAVNEEELEAIYGELGKELVITEEETEVTSLFSIASVLLFMIGGGCSLLWFGRVP